MPPLPLPTRASVCLLRVPAHRTADQHRAAGGGEAARPTAAAAGVTTWGVWGTEAAAGREERGGGTTIRDTAGGGDGGRIDCQPSTRRAPTPGGLELRRYNRGQFVHASQEHDAVGR